MPDFDTLNKECLEIRNEIIDIIHNAKSGHSGGSLSSVEILWTLYSQFLQVRPDEPAWPDRDRFVLSKGHGAPLLYTVLGRLGFFDRSELMTLRQTGSMLQGHPDMHKTPGVEISSGSLGMGISVGVGMALSNRLDGRTNRVYVLVGDGELQEGQNWEGIMSAHKFGLDNLVIIVDNNGVQLDGTTDQIMPMLDVAGKLKSFGLQTTVCDGHSCEELHRAFEWAHATSGGPKAIVANTVKGKGVSFMEGQSSWHGAPITDELYEKAKAELVL